MTTTARSASRDKVRAHRARLRKAGFAPFRFGFRTFGRSPSLRPHTVSRWRWQRVLTPDGPGVRRRNFCLECGMKRGEIRTVAGGAAYAGKPRPAVIVQDDRFDANDSIVVCPLTTDPTPAPIFRLPSSPARRVDCVRHAA